MKTKRTLGILMVLLITSMIGSASAKTFVLPKEARVIGEAAFKNCTEFSGKLIIPTGVQAIEAYAFAGCSGFTGVPQIPSTVKTIGPYAFEGCSGLFGELRLGPDIDVDETAFAGCENLTVTHLSEWRIAMITDYGDITDQSFNQTTYEATKAYCEANGMESTYYKPAGDSTAERIAMVEKAVNEDYNVIIMPGYVFGDTIVEVQDEYSDIKFIALDVSAGDLYGSEPASNVYCAVYQVELCGYMAGYAAVKLGYTHLGFLGGMAIPEIVRYGYGFVQGADDAANEIGADVTVEYVYGNQFYGDADITAYMDSWYQTLGVQAVFACGGDIYFSAAEAAAKVDGAKIIGVDVDQLAMIDELFGTDGLVITSAIKGLGATVNTLLKAIIDGRWEMFGGKIETLGIVSADAPEENYVQLAHSTQFNGRFRYADYKALVSSLYNGELTVSNVINTMPKVSITVNDHGVIK